MAAEAEHGEGGDGVGSAADPASGADILMVVPHDGRDPFDPFTGAKIARDLNSDPDL